MVVALVVIIIAVVVVVAVVVAAVGINSCQYFLQNFMGANYYLERQLISKVNISLEAMSCATGLLLHYSNSPIHGMV